MVKHVHITQQIKAIEAPASKSFAQRVLYAMALSGTNLTIENLGESDDVLHIKSIVAQLGWRGVNNDASIHFTKQKNTDSNTVNIGESGLGTRLSASILSRFFDDFTVIGKGSILKRPMNWFSDNLPQTGLTIKLNNGYLPLRVSGQIKAGHYVVDGAESSQYISGLVMVLPLCDGDSVLEVKNPTSNPYIDITLAVMADFGVKITHSNYERYDIKGHQTYQHKSPQYRVEGDYSSAAFWIVYGLLTDGIAISNLNPVSVQADKAILEVVELVGGTFSWENDILNIHPPKKLQPFNFDATHCPDLFPILTILAAGIKGQSTITGTSRLVHKESNRVAVILKEFSKFALKMEHVENSLLIEGTGSLSSASIESHNDHRIAMSAAIASILTPNGIDITNPASVNKSYPEFWATLAAN